MTFWDPLTADVAAEPLTFVRDVAALATVSLPEGGQRLPSPTDRNGAFDQLTGWQNGEQFTTRMYR